MCIWFIQSKNNMKHRVLSNLDMCLYCETRQGFKQIMSIFLDSEILWCVSRKAGGAIYFPPEIPVAWTRYWILPCHWQNDRGCAIETSQNYSVFISKKKKGPYFKVQNLWFQYFHAKVIYIFLLIEKWERSLPFEADLAHELLINSDSYLSEYVCVFVCCNAVMNLLLESCLC